MLLLNFKVSVDGMVLDPSMVVMMMGFLTSSLFFSSLPTLGRKNLRLQVLCDGSQSTCDELWLTMTELAVEVLFSSCNRTRVDLWTNRHCDLHRLVSKHCFVESLIWLAIHVLQV